MSMKKGEQKKAAGAYAEAGSYASLGIQFAVTILLFTAAGWWLDGQVDTTPLFILLGTLLGAVGGFYKLYRTLMDMDEKRKQEESR